ncbi:MAG TPA: DinB family protein [Methylomirabilota bacterium]
MPSREAYMRRPLEQRLARLARTPDELDEAFRTRSADVLARRPDASNWSATEIVCHLRDVEELFRIRFHTILALDDPKILTLSADPDDLAAWGIGGAVGHPLDPDRWAEDRLYARADPGHALAGFRRHRSETLSLLNSRSDAQWLRGGIHSQRGRLTLGDWVASLASHDDNHVDQLRRALDGRP